MGALAGAIKGVMGERRSSTASSSSTPARVSERGNGLVQEGPRPNLFKEIGRILLSPRGSVRRSRLIGGRR